MSHCDNKVSIGVQAIVRHEAAFFHSHEIRSLDTIFSALVRLHVNFDFRLGVDFVCAIGSIGYNVNSLSAVFPIHALSVGG